MGLCAAAGCGVGRCRRSSRRGVRACSGGVTTFSTGGGGCGFSAEAEEEEEERDESEEEVPAAGSAECRGRPLGEEG